jgi:hypothetical protein
MPIVIFLIGIAAGAASPLSSSQAPMDHVFNGDYASNKLTAATLRNARIARLFLPRAGGQWPVIVF